MTYTPQPIDTSKIVLSDEILELIERLAENSHDIWAQQRIADGWSIGPARNDLLKQHPCLVPYRELPEPEKEYDRKVVEQCLKAVMSLGYDIGK